MSGTGRVRLVVVLLAAGLIATGVLAGHSPDLLVSRMEGGLQAVRDLGDAGRALFAVAQVLVAVSGILPASMLGVAAGVLYGLPAGFLVSGASTLAGAVLAFALSRSVLRPAVRRVLARRPRLRELDGMVAKDGWRMACLLRVSPVMPFAATSYALGLSSIGLRDYVVGTLAAMPALFGYVLLGTLAGSGITVWSSRSPLGGWMLALGVVATLVLTLRVGQLVARVVRPAAAPLGEDLAS